MHQVCLQSWVRVRLRITCYVMIGITCYVMIGRYDLNTSVSAAAPRVLMDVVHYASAELDYVRCVILMPKIVLEPL